MKLSSRSVFWLLLSAYFCLGFRAYPGGGSWDIDNSSTARTKLFVDYTQGTRVVKNDLPSSDPLYGLGDQTVAQLMTSIFSDINGVAASYVTLADLTDTDYSAANGLNRTIEVRFSGADGVSGGEAKLELKDGESVGCDISAETDLLDSAKTFVRTMTHELGHCLGLDHPQETVHAIMSYFHDADEDTRLLIDDKMGLAFLYPVDKSASKESSTFGMSCARKD